MADEASTGPTAPVAEGETPLENAARNADLGIPAGGASLGLAKRVTERATRWFVHRQIGFNRATVAALRAQQEVSERLQQRVERFEEMIEATRADQRQELARWRGDHAVVQRVLSEVRAGREPADVVAELAQDPDDHDAFYADFENLHRGSVELIMGRLRTYLPEMQAVAGLGRVLDIGTGRGEFLDLMRDAGIDAYGVDTNAVTVAECSARGLEVAHDDALHHLEQLPDDSLGAVTGFHIVEHVPFGSLLDLVAEARRVLAPGGVLVLETPHPGNLIVGASNFYMDPTHLRPLPPPLLHAVLWSRGFDPVEVRYVNASPPSFTLPEDLGDAEPLRPVVERLEELLTGPADFAVLGRVPAD